MPFSQHVLLVDDHPAVRAVLLVVITRLYPEATIVEASNGVEALLAVSQQQPDLIITDYQMPVMSGLELVDTLRRQGATMPILVLSSDTSIAGVLIAKGASAFLSKPFQLPTLRDLLQTLLPESGATQAVGV